MPLPWHCQPATSCYAHFGDYPDISDPEFHGIYSFGEAFIGPRPNTKTHPHLRLDDTMVSVPKVYPGDMVFWHCVRPLEAVLIFVLSSVAEYAVM